MAPMIEGERMPLQEAEVNSYAVLKDGFTRTPSPPQDSDTPNESSGSRRKRVGFTGAAKYLSPLKANAAVRPLSTSRDRSSVRSILKPSPQPMPRSSREVITQSSAMMQSAMDHLKSDSLLSRQDAYDSLLACLGAYTDLPDLATLQTNMEELATCIRRDLGLKDDRGHVRDLLLTTKALQFVAYTLFTPNFADFWSDSFRAEVVSQALLALEDLKSPKSLVIHYLHILQRQKFRSGALSADVATRIVMCLGNVCQRFKGNRVVSFRLMILQRLLSQHPSVMRNLIDCWFDALLAGLFSQIADIRRRAANFGLEAALSLGDISEVTVYSMMRLNAQSPEGVKCVDRLQRRLEEMSKRSEDAVDVPSAWIVILLFLRGRPQQVERWEHLRSWLKPIQTCFNSTDPQVKLQTNIAWSRFIFAVDLDKSNIAALLQRPIAAQLASKRVPIANQMARSTYSTLLYYAFRPGTTYQQLDQYWDLYISSILPTATMDISHAFVLLDALFQPKGPVWCANRANLAGSIASNELPAIESGWVRSRMPKIMETIVPLLVRSISIDAKEKMLNVWSSLMQSIHHVEGNPLQAIAAVLETCRLVKIDDPKWILVPTLIRLAVDMLPPRLLREKRFSYQNGYKLESTYTGQESAIGIMLQMMLDHSDSADLVQHIMLLNMEMLTCVTDLAQIQEYLAFMSSKVAYGAPERIIWLALSQRVITLLNSDRDQYDYAIHQHVLALLKTGARISDDEASIWEELLSASIEAVRRQDLQPEVITAALSPLLESLDLISQPRGCETKMFACFLRKASLLWNEQADTRFIPGWEDMPKISPAETASQMMNLVRKLLEAGYDYCLTTEVVQTLKSLLDSRFQERLDGVESGLFRWIEDRSGLLAHNDIVWFQQIWKAIVIQDTPDGQCISPETFLPGLRSRHRSTLDFTATLWNRHFGRRSDVIYSEAVSQALGRAGKVTKLLTPGIFPSSKCSELPLDLIDEAVQGTSSATSSTAFHEKTSLDAESSLQVDISSQDDFQVQEDPATNISRSQEQDSVISPQQELEVQDYPATNMISSQERNSDISPQQGFEVLENHATDTSFSQEPALPGSAISSMAEEFRPPTEDPAGAQLLAEMLIAHSQTSSPSSPTAGSRKRRGEMCGAECKRVRSSFEEEPIQVEDSVDSSKFDHSRSPAPTTNCEKVPDSLPATDSGETARRLITDFESMMHRLSHAVLRPEEERTLVDILFESVHQTHEAGRRCPLSK